MTPEQIEKRKRIMGRSIALGHCVCDPQKPCPCPLFKDRNVCECAGERLPSTTGPVRLTEHVRSAGCASKIGKKDLLEILQGLPDISDDRIMVGRSAGDDAGVIMLSEEQATILTVDVFAPSVNDPYTFGQIAAANSVSDIYAMGGTPQVALSIIGFPIHSLAPEIMREILRGGIDKMQEAGISVIGGHSINDEEVKCGFAVVGSAPQGQFITNTGAIAGDAIVLTKPLGAGIVAFAAQIGRASEEAADTIANSMATLNKPAAEAMQEFGAHAATDVTGFGLLGHMCEIVRHSGVEVEIDFDSLPIFPEVKPLAQQDVLPGAVERNREAVPTELLDLSKITSAQRAVLFSPETSGGLLVFLPAKQAEKYVKKLRQAGVSQAAIIGKVTGKHQQGLITVLTSQAEAWPSQELVLKASPSPALAASEAPDLACCCADGDAAPAPSVPSTAQPQGHSSGGRFFPPVNDNANAAFKSYMAAVNAPGALGAKEKKIISLALSVLAKCGPCVKLSTEAARQAGVTEEEISEAIALGISFGGAPVNMFYNDLRR
ncbi:MAG: selenide, water dikinase SelD [Planctomycetes bacterium]|nr:selenide, water dikinase SelD [Planctomycetota bacterium]